LTARIRESINVRLINIAGLTVALLLLAVIVNSQSEFFLTQRNLLNVGRAVAITGVIAAATTVVLIAGELDLSIGSTLGLSGIVTATVLSSGGPLPAALFAGLMTGLVIGLANAGLVVGIGVNPLIATLGMLFTLRGLGYVSTGGKPALTFGLEDFAFIGQGQVLGVPFSVLILIGVFAIVGIALSVTVAGSHVYSIGGDRTAANLAGVPVGRIRTSVYVVSGISASLAGIMLASVNGSADPNAGQGIELVVISSVILGGTALTGGRGGLVGTALGVVFLGALANGMNLIGLPGYWQILVQGVVLLAAVVIDRLVSRT